MKMLSPVKGVGVSSVEGFAAHLNVAPFGLEVALGRRLGLELETTLFYEISALRSGFSGVWVTLALPVYFIESTPARPYHGFYVRPFVFGGFDLKFQAPTLGPGVGLGYAWQLENGIQLKLGLDAGFQTILPVASGPIFGAFGGLQLSVGYWLL